MARGSSWLELSTVCAVSAAVALAAWPRVERARCAEAHQEARENLLALRTQQAAYARTHGHFGEVWAGCPSASGCGRASVCATCEVDFRPTGTRYHYWTSWTGPEGYVAHAASNQLPQRELWTMTVAEQGEVVAPGADEPALVEDGCR
jgi:hypothetical protein